MPQLTPSAQKTLDALKANPNQQIEGTKPTLADYGVATQAAPVISSDTLKTTPRTFNPIPQKTGTESAALSGAIETNQDFYTKNLETQAQQAEKSRTASFDQLLAGLLETPGKAELTANAYADEGGVDAIQKELNNINQEILTEQNANRRRIEAIEKNAVGALRSGVEQEIDRVNRESLRKQADLSIIQMGIQGRYDSAKAIADRAIDVQLERQKTRNEALALNYQENKELFTTAEKRAFEAAQADRERAFEDERTKLKEISDLSLLALQNGADGATVKAIRETTTPEEAQRITGNFLAPKIEEMRILDIQQKQASIRASQQSVINSQNDLLFKRAELGDVNALRELGISTDPSSYVRLTPAKAQAVQKEVAGNDAYKALVKATDSIAAMKGYETKFKEVGTTSGFGSPFENEKLKTVYNKAVLNLKEFYNLGALNGPDLEVVQSTLGNPTDRSFFKGVATLGISSIAARKGAEEGIRTTYNQIEQSLDDRYLALRAQYGNYDPSQVTIVDDIDRRYLNAKAQVNPNVAKFLAENPDMPLEDIVQVINTKF